jgi:hypothetical protein
MGQSSTAQGGSGSFKDRKPIGEVRQIYVFFSITMDKIPVSAPSTKPPGIQESAPLIFTPVYI